VVSAGSETLAEQSRRANHVPALGRNARTARRCLGAKPDRTIMQLAGNNLSAALWPVFDRATPATEGLQYRGRPSVGGFGGVGDPRRAASVGGFGGVGDPRRAEAVSAGSETRAEQWWFRRGRRPSPSRRSGLRAPNAGPTGVEPDRPVKSLNGLGSRFLAKVQPSGHCGDGRGGLQQGIMFHRFISVADVDGMLSPRFPSSLFSEVCTMFSLGVLELLLTVAIAIPAGVFFLRGIPGTRWLVAATACFAAASVLTPADIATTLLFGVAFLGCFYCGTKQPRPRSIASM
jgi:hypothetical protein